ncbi:MAG: type VI secretion system tube protein TssD [Niabella sp.]
MALNAYLRLKGQNQGNIKGSVTLKGRENTIEVIACNHEVVLPRDAASGLATGKRRHLPLVITKELDRSTPLLMQALISGEVLTSFELQFYTSQNTAGIGRTGAEKNYYTIRLTNATLSGIKMAMPNNKNPELVKYKEFEEVSFVYEKIEWIWIDGGITTLDTIP